MAGTAGMAAITEPPFMTTDFITDLATTTTGPVTTITAVMIDATMTGAAAMTIQAAVTIGGAGRKPAQTVPIRRVQQGRQEMTADRQASPICTFLQSADLADTWAISSVETTSGRRKNQRRPNCFFKHAWAVLSPRRGSVSAFRRASGRVAVLPPEFRLADQVLAAVRLALAQGQDRLAGSYLVPALGLVLDHPYHTSFVSKG